MLYNYSKLRGKIKEFFGTQDKFAFAMQISTATLSDKLNGKSSFTQQEINSACGFLEIATQEIPIYFFNLQQSSQD